MLGGHGDKAGWSDMMQHISQCEQCRLRWESVREVWGGLDELEVDTAKVDLVGRVVGAVEAEGAGGKSVALRSHWVGKVMRMAASIILAVVLGHFAGRWSMTGTVEAEQVAVSIHLDVLAPASVTGWGEYILQEQLENNEASVENDNN